MPEPVHYRPEELNAAALGGILRLLERARVIGEPFRPRPAMLARLPGGELYVDTQLALDTDGWPEGAGRGDPHWHRNTSYHYRDGSSLNANEVPYIVLPQPVEWGKAMGIYKGDVAAVLYRGTVAFAVCGDYGREGRLGEGSIELLRQLGEERLRSDGTIINAGIPRNVVTIVFPGTRLARKPSDQATLLQHIGSVGRARFSGISAGNFGSARVSVQRGLPAEIVDRAKQEYAAYGLIPEAESPLRERVNEYWTRLGEPERDGASDFAWSAAFVSWVMRQAGCGGKFTYSGRHSKYVQKAIANSQAERFDRVCGYRPQDLRIAPGDVLAMNRSRSPFMSFDFAARHDRYESHCDIVTEVGASEIHTIGGNVGAGTIGTKTFVWQDGQLVNRDSSKQRVFAVLRLPT